MNTLAILAAAASWSAPQTVSAPHTFVGPLLAGADQHGGALVAWGWQDGVGDNRPTGAGQVTVSGGTVSAEQKAPIGIVAVAGYGEGRSIELASRQLNPSGTRWRLTVRDGARTTRLATGFVLFRPQLAVAPDGTALVAWVELHGQRHVVRAALRSGTGSFGRPVSIVSSGQTTLVSAAVSEHGDALVAFVRGRRVLVRVRRPGAGWGSAALLETAHVKTTWQLSAAFDGSRRAVVVWRRHRFSRPGHPGVTPLSAATLGAGAKRWSAAQSLEADGARDPALQPAPSGRLLLAYVDGPNSHATARVRLAGAGGRFGAAQDAAPAQGGLRSLSAFDDSSSGLVVGWVIPNPSGDGAGIGYAAVQAPGQAQFGAREQVTPNEAAFDLRLLPASAGVRAFWTARPGGTGPSVPVSKIHTVVRTALRSE